MNFEQIISMAFVMGLIGSFHCLGMCGPIAMALPMGHRNNSGRLLGGVIYNLGRVFTYSFLGLILGMAGDFLISPKIQNTVSITFGAFIVIYLLFALVLMLFFYFGKNALINVWIILGIAVFTGLLFLITQVTVFKKYFISLR